MHVTLYEGMRALGFHIDLGTQLKSCAMKTTIAARPRLQRKLDISSRADLCTGWPPARPLLWHIRISRSRRDALHESTFK